MRTLSNFLALLIFFQYAFFPQATRAAAVSYTAGATTTSGAVKGQVPVNKIGTLLLADALVFLNSNEIEIKGKDSNGQNQTLLNGVITNAQVIGGGHHAKIRGTAYFQGGTRLKDLCLKGAAAAESIILNDGTKIVGDIRSADAGGFAITTPSGDTRRVDLNAVKVVNSPCIWGFTVPLSCGSPIPSGQSFTCESDKITFDNNFVPTTTAVVGTGSDRWSPNRKFVMLVVALCLIATAIAVPVAVATSHHHRSGGNAQPVATVSSSGGSSRSVP